MNHHKTESIINQTNFFDALPTKKNQKTQHHPNRKKKKKKDTKTKKSEKFLK